MTLQLVDGSIKRLKGIVEDLMFQVEKFKVPMDFVVLEMKGALMRNKEQVIVLGRPLMATTKIVIDVQNGKLTMIVSGETVELKADTNPVKRQIKPRFKITLKTV